MQGLCRCDENMHAHCQWCQEKIMILDDGCTHTGPVCVEFRTAVEGLDEDSFVKLPGGVGWKVIPNSPPPAQVGAPPTLN